MWLKLGQVHELQSKQPQQTNKRKEGLSGRTGPRASSSSARRRLKAPHVRGEAVSSSG